MNMSNEPTAIYDLADTILGLDLENNFLAQMKMLLDFLTSNYEEILK